jgi:[CysO sulfur-carrier protein]-S-L-cysteine hydrolase
VVKPGSGGSGATEHPGPASVGIPAVMVQLLIDHARTGFPNEACGVIVGDAPAAAGGRPLRWEPAANVAASPFRYEIDPDELYRLTVAVDDADEAFWGIVHSHTHTAARPSATDVGQAFYPDALYILVSLSSEEEDEVAAAPLPTVPTVRAWRIVGGEMFEVELLVEAGEAGA